MDKFIELNAELIILEKKLENDSISSEEYSKKVEKITKKINIIVSSEEFSKNKIDFNTFREVNEKVNETLKYEENFKDLSEKNINLLSNLSKIENNLVLERESFKTKVITLQKEAQKKLNKLKNENVEYFNKEKSLIKKYGNQKFFTEFVALYSNLKLAIDFGSKSNNEEMKRYMTGFVMINSNIENLLIDFGLKEIKPKIGEKFNPDLHNVINVNGKLETINKVLKPGYKLYDRVIIPASVETGNIPS
ncbi:MAG: nucleotide exchange factor GrpE [Mollicutes bacterium PWAP]|nr:nucleotide exchange factor GrpE [Mollicutes bacterium PWAP]